MIKEDKSERCRDEIIIEYDAIKGFGDNDIWAEKKVQMALAIVLEQDAHDQFTLDQALEIIKIRVGGFNITSAHDLTPLSCQSTVVALEDSFEIVVGINKELEDKIKELEDKIKDHEKTYIRMALKINSIKQRSK